MIEIVTPAEVDEGFWFLALDHLKIDDEDLHPLIEHYIEAAIGQVEACSGRKLLKRTCRLTLDSFNRTIALPASPAIKVTSITYLDTAGDEMTLDPASYALVDRLEWPKLIPARGHSWPATWDFPGSVKITFEAGFGEGMEKVPAPLRQAVLLTCADWFRFGGNVATIALHGIPDDAYRACQPFRREWQ